MAELENRADLHREWTEARVALVCSTTGALLLQLPDLSSPGSAMGNIADPRTRTATRRKGVRGVLVVK
jgi:hypothetical protein